MHFKGAIYSIEDGDFRMKLCTIFVRFKKGKSFFLAQISVELPNDMLNGKEAKGYLEITNA